MGRKRSLPRVARQEAVAEQAAEALEADRRDAVIQSKSDDALFVLDVRGSGRKRRKVQKEAKDRKVFSKNEKGIVKKKYLGKKSIRRPVRNTIQDPWAGEGDVSAVASGTRGRRDGVTTEAGEGVACRSKNRNINAKADFVELRRKPGQQVKRPALTTKDKAKLGVCHPGQSYNPTEEDHDDVLASAVAVELRREEAVADEKTSVSQGMSKETLSILLGDDKDEASSDDEDENNGMPTSIGNRTPATGKLTRAQRNKQGRKKQAKNEQAAKRRRKELAESINELTALELEIAEQEMVRGERRQTKLLVKTQKHEMKARGASAGGVLGPSAGIVGVGAVVGGSVDNRDVIEGRSVPVNLGEELHGSLRKLRTHGSILLDKVELLKASKAHPDRRKAKVRAKKTPKGFRKKHKLADRYKD